MRPNSKSLDTAARHIQRHGWNRYAKAPIAPEAAEGICRWCRGRKNMAGFCNTGCSDAATLTPRCAVCSREFETGNRHAVTCFECDRQETAALTSAGGTPWRPRDAFAERHRRWDEEDHQ